jgi:hypothetical protein
MNDTFRNGQFQMRCVPTGYNIAGRECVNARRHNANIGCYLTPVGGVDQPAFDNTTWIAVGERRTYGIIEYRCERVVPDSGRVRYAYTGACAHSNIVLPNYSNRLHLQSHRLPSKRHMGGWICASAMPHGRQVHSDRYV